MHHKKEEEAYVTGSCGWNRRPWKSQTGHKLRAGEREGGRERGRERPRKNRPETIREDLKGLSLPWIDALEAAEDRDRWRKCVARCAVLHGKDSGSEVRTKPIKAVQDYDADGRFK